MGDWKQCKLADLGEIVGGATPSTKDKRFYGGNIAWITPKDLSNSQSRFISYGERNITIKGLNSCSAKLMPQYSVLFTSRAPIGYIAIAKNEVCTNQGFKSIVPNADTDYLFLYYLLLYNRDKIENMGSGTTFKEVSGSAVKQFEVYMPTNKKEQKEIAKILDALDSKIENNNKINEKLEEIAQALFKRWFIDFEFPDENGNPYKSSGGEMVESELGMIPKGWEVGYLSGIANITMGQSPNGESYNKKRIGVPFYQGAAEFGCRFPTKRLFTAEPKRMAKQNDILISVRAPVGNINIATEACCIGRGLAAVHSKYQSYLLYQLQSMKNELNMFNSEGTVFGSINRNDLNNLKIIIPPEKNIHEFQNLISKMDNLIINIFFETKLLIKTRNILLPQLMSGNII